MLLQRVINKVFRPLTALALLLGLAFATPQAFAQDDEFDLSDELEAEVESASDSLDDAFSEFEDENFDLEEGLDEEFSQDFAEDEFGEDEFLEDDFSEEEVTEEDFSDDLEEGLDEEFVDESFLESEAESLGIEPLDEEVSDEDFLSDEIELPEPQPLGDQLVGVADFRQPDLPNLEYEARLYDIYVNYHTKKLSDTEWATIAGGRTSESYKIQKGDSLWDISSTFFGDGNYWPKIWALNGGIKNPHLIKEENSIRFILGDGDDAPAFTVTEPEIEQPDSLAPEPQLSEGELQKVEFRGTGEEPDFELPPPLQSPSPVLTRLPPSLPFLDIIDSGGPEDEEYDESGISYVRRKILDIKDVRPLTGYVAESVPQSLGRVLETESTNRIATTYNYIFVAMESNDADVGDNFLVLQNNGKLNSPNSEVRGDLGYSIEVQGEIELVERVDSEVSDEPNTFRAVVTNSVNPIRVEAMLVRGEVQGIEVKNEGPRSQVVAQIIGGPLFNRRQVFGTEAIAFLNRGESAGLSPGQILPIRANRATRNPDTIIAGKVRPIGWLRVVKTTANFATAVVTSSWDQIYSGDVTGAGRMYARGDVVGPGAVSNATESDDDGEFFEGFDEEGELEEDFDEEEEGDEFFDEFEE